MYANEDGYLLHYTGAAKWHIVLPSVLHSGWGLGIRFIVCILGVRGRRRVPVAVHSIFKRQWITLRSLCCGNTYFVPCL